MVASDGPGIGNARGHVIEVPEQSPLFGNRPLAKCSHHGQRGFLDGNGDLSTRHEHAGFFLAVANEIDIKIAIAQPAAKE